LFGHRQGAFTGADRDRIGILADCPPGGAVFLDEIGDLDPHVQVKLLRVLEERRFTPVGANEPEPFHGRILAATHVDLPAAIHEGRFRQDLFYRLEGDGIRVPSLRRRLDDAPNELRQIARTLLERLVPADAAAEILDEICVAIDRDLGADWSWPGNVRELAQVVRRILLHGHCIPDAAPAAAQGLGALAAEGVSMADVQRRYATLVYERTGSFAGAGDVLGVDWRTVRSWVRPD
jgi:transcriptional regulator with PAS, ATPase and Fis domain